MEARVQLRWSLVVVLILALVYTQRENYDFNTPSSESEMVLNAKSHRTLSDAQSSDSTKALFQKWNVGRAKDLAQDVLSLIRARYELNGPIGSQFWLTSNNMKIETFNIMKYKFMKKILASPSTKNPAEKSFLMIFGGSSVTAGHDSYFNQSYPQIVLARMGPILAELGVELQVHNIAQGANNCSPYQLCYESMGGHDPDWIGWEQSYNCGHDDAIFELAARIAGFSKNKAVIYYSASGAWAPSSCPPSADPKPYSDSDWTPAAANIPAWKPTAADIAKEKELLNKYATSVLAAKRFTSYNDGGHNYQAVSPHGFNVWESNPNCRSRDKQDKQDITGCNGIDAAQQCKLKFMTKEASVYGQEGGHGANWHPTRAFHMLRGEAISWLYTLALLEGVLELEARIEKLGKDVQMLDDTTRQLWWTEYATALDKLQPPLPAPKRCQLYHCEARPICYTDYLPHFASDLALKDVIVGKTNWKYEPEIYGDWSVKYGYLDSKPLWSAEGNQGELHLRITIRNTRTVWVCGAVKESLLKTVMYLDPQVSPTQLKHYQPSENRIEWTKKKYMGNECKAITDLPVGTHVLSISTSNVTDAHHVTGFSHLITWE